MKQLHLWAEDQLSPPSLPYVNPGGQSDATKPSDDCELIVPSVEAAAPAISNETMCGPPVAVPLQSAIEVGVFGMTLDGPIIPDEEQVQDLSAELANEMIILLADSQILEEAIRLEYDPATGCTPSTKEAKQALLAKLDMEWKRLLQAYDDAVGAYSDGFGEVAAQTLDQWVRKVIADVSAIAPLALFPCGRQCEADSDRRDSRRPRCWPLAGSASSKKSQEAFAGNAPDVGP